jgi:hypothetical protein
MIPKNNMILIEPVKEGMISEARGAVYRVLGVPDLGTDYDKGDQVIVEPERVVCVTVSSVETFFINADEVLAVIPCQKI